MDESMVTISLDDYTELVIAKEHLDRIISTGFRGAELSWNKKSIRLDTSSIEDYIKVIRPIAVKNVFEKLTEEAKQNEEPDNA